MEEEIKTHLLSIAGFDPSGGAGILADIKTFEANKVFGLGVCTAITFQNDSEFEGVNWIGEEDIKKQLDILLRKFHVEWVKIGLIEDMSVLNNLLDYLKDYNPTINIIWDPIIKASAGFVFHQGIDSTILKEICKKLYMITPNLEEIKKLLPNVSPEKGANELSSYCNVLLKGGHGESDKARDLLFENGLITMFESDKVASQKHGTGCVLSSAILTNLAKGYDLKSACREGKEYITDFIKSDSGLLGFHYV